MKLFELVNRLDALPAWFGDFEVVIIKEGRSFCVVDIEIDGSGHAVALVDESERNIDDTICDAADRAEVCDRRSEYPTNVNLTLELN